MWRGTQGKNYAICISLGFRQREMEGEGSFKGTPNTLKMENLITFRCPVGEKLKDERLQK